MTISRRSFAKGIAWEALGVLSLCVYTGDVGFSLAWVGYRVTTFPIYELVFKIITRKFNKQDGINK
jgi:hypothetical protein